MSADDGGTKPKEIEAVATTTNGEGSVTQQQQSDAPKVEPPEADDFGLPVRPPRRRWTEEALEEVDGVNGSGSKPTEPPAINGAGERASAEAEATAAANSQEAQAEGQRPRAATLDDLADREAARRESVISKKSSTVNDRNSSDNARNHSNSVSEWSHQALAPPVKDTIDEDEKELEWQQMPAFATHRIYDDWGKVLAKEYGEGEGEEQTVGYGALGGAGKGYTRVQIDDDAESATSMDDHTAYLFKDPHTANTLDEDEEGRDTISQMQTTKELLTEGQRIAYVGVVRLAIGRMLDELNKVEKTKATKKQLDFALEAMKMWGQKMMVRLYSHMEIDSAEQIMVEQLAEHGVLPSDLTPALMQNARVKNPAAKVESETSSFHSARASMSSPRPSSVAEKENGSSTPNLAASNAPSRPSTPPPPAYEEHTAEELTVQDPSQIENSKDLDLDIRWTVLCDLFLLLIADSTYDARSRTLLEHVAGALSVSWQEVCRFEKRVTDALEMQEQADKENWNEEDHLETRKKAARKRRLMVMGLCTVGGGLVIGLSAGLLAPVIGAGLAAGFTTIGVSGTSAFLGGTGAAALIGSAGTLTGSIVGVRASARRTGAVKTFEYRPLFNNKRPNLIVTIAGWMTGKVDDVRLPFSTVDPIMGDMYSVHWEPDMLQSTGQTIQILATEALTQTIQQILGSTLLTALMAGLSVPIVLTKLSYLIDNPWTVSLARADATGLILADSLIDRNLGVRPITFVGFSLGSRVIFSCLRELARRGALGLVQNVYLFGSPVIMKKDEYIRARSVVSGRFVNGFATNDWILGYLFRATSGGIGRVSGLASIDIPGIENLDCTEMVPGHMAYRVKMPALLEKVGWLVDSLEFSEIEDPDPENHIKRQRELINEIEAARQELEEKRDEKQKKGGFKAFFSRKKGPEKKAWETYDERSQKVLEGDDKEVEEKLKEENANVMFDVDAIRQEALKLAVQGGDIEEIKRHLSIREIETTMPALKLASLNLPAETNGEVREGLRQTKSFDEATATQSKNEEAPAPNGYHPPPESSGLGISERENVSPALKAVNGVSEESASVKATPSPSQTPERPPLRSAATTPAPTSIPPAEIKDPTLNPWSDDDDRDFGKERNVEMSFE